MIGAEEPVYLGEEPLVVADPGRMIGSFQLDVAYVMQVLCQVAAVGGGSTSSRRCSTRLRACTAGHRPRTSIAAAIWMMVYAAAGLAP